MKRRGSALLMALWIIVVLSVMVLSFSIEAKMQAGVNVYVREKNRVKRLVDSGKILGEMILLNYKDVKDWQADEDEKELLEDDRWYKEKRDLKGGEGTKGGECEIGPILLDPDHPDSGTVSIRIRVVTSERKCINLNEFYKEENLERWRQILAMIGISYDEGRKSFRTQDGKSANLADLIVKGWMDYRDDDDSTNKVTGDERDSEKEEYKEFYEDHDEDYAEEDRFEPKNGPISELKELSHVKIFQEYPAVLTGGVINPWADKDEQITVSGGGLLGIGVFGVDGGNTFNVNHATKEALLTVPGIYDADEADEEDKEESEKAADAIIKCLAIKPRDSDYDEELGYYPYKDFSDLCKRVEDEFPDVEIGQEASQYLMFKPDDNTVFNMTITAASMGMKHEAECEGYVDSENKKIRYIRWKE